MLRYGAGRRELLPTVRLGGRRSLPALRDFDEDGFVLDDFITISLGVRDGPEEIHVCSP